MPCFFLLTDSKNLGIRKGREEGEGQRRNEIRKKKLLGDSSPIPPYGGEVQVVGQKGTKSGGYSGNIS